MFSNQNLKTISQHFSIVEFHRHCAWTEHLFFMYYYCLIFRHGCDVPLNSFNIMRNHLFFIITCRHCAMISLWILMILCLENVTCANLNISCYFQFLSWIFSNLYLINAHPLHDMRTADNQTAVFFIFRIWRMIESKFRFFG